MSNIVLTGILIHVQLVWFCVHLHRKFTMIKIQGNN